jgi:hypothetical protein
MVTPFLRKGPGSHRDFPCDLITPFVSLRRAGVTPSTSKGGIMDPFHNLGGGPLPQRGQPL